MLSTTPEFRENKSKKDSSRSFWESNWCHSEQEGRELWVSLTQLLSPLTAEPGSCPGFCQAAPSITCTLPSLSAPSCSALPITLFHKLPTFWNYFFTKALPQTASCFWHTCLVLKFLYYHVNGLWMEGARTLYAPFTFLNLNWVWRFISNKFTIWVSSHIKKSLRSSWPFVTFSSLPSIWIQCEKCLNQKP